MIPTFSFYIYCQKRFVIPDLRDSDSDYQLLVGCLHTLGTLSPSLYAKMRFKSVVCFFKNFNQNVIS
mgnify:CR=1 FL=1